MTDAQESLTLSRVLDTPREAVWGAWTDPAVLARWWWPARFQTVYEVDLRPGGRYSFRTADLPDLGVLALSGAYLEVRGPERLVYSWHWGGEDRPTQVEVEFLDRAGKTEIGVTHRGFAGADECANHVMGWNDCLDRLEALFSVAATGGEPERA